MDIFNLIRAVRCREPIWNRQHPQYKDRECSLMLWTEVANETGVDVETARCKWRGLRDTFRVQLRKLNQAIKNGSSSPLTWEYFDEMVFVKDQIYIDINRRKYYAKDRPIGEFLKLNDDIKFKRNDGEEDREGRIVDRDGKKQAEKINVGSLLQNRLECPIQSAIEQAIRLRMEQPMPPSDYPPYSQNLQFAINSNYPTHISGENSAIEDEMDFQVPANFCVAEVTEDTETQLEFDSETNDGADTNSRNSEDGDQSICERSVSSSLLQKKLKALQDDNYCFLMSILPQMKTLPTKQKLFVRIKIQELLFSEILSMENRD